MLWSKTSCIISRSHRSTGWQQPNSLFDLWFKIPGSAEARNVKSCSLSLKPIIELCERCFSCIFNSETAASPATASLSVHFEESISYRDSHYWSHAGSQYRTCILSTRRYGKTAADNSNLTCLLRGNLSSCESRHDRISVTCTQPYSLHENWVNRVLFSWWLVLQCLKCTHDLTIESQTYEHNFLSQTRNEWFPLSPCDFITTAGSRFSASFPSSVLQ